MFPPQGGLEGSVLTYHCGPGKYPFPVSYRICGADGEWSPMRLANGRPASRATCKGNWIFSSCFCCFLHSLLFSSSSPSIPFFLPIYLSPISRCVVSSSAPAGKWRLLAQGSVVPCWDNAELLLPAWLHPVRVSWEELHPLWGVDRNHSCLWQPRWEKMLQNMLMLTYILYINLYFVLLHRISNYMKPWAQFIRHIRGRVLRWACTH